MNRCETVQVRMITMAVAVMDTPVLVTYQPSCMLAHHLIDQLAIIVGQCDLLEEHAAKDSECEKHLHAIRDVAKAMADDLSRHQCHLDNMLRHDTIQRLPK